MYTAERLIKNPQNIINDTSIDFGPLQDIRLVYLNNIYMMKLLNLSTKSPLNKYGLSSDGKPFFFKNN